MDTYIEFILKVPSDEGNLAYEAFDKDLIKFFRIIFQTILKKQSYLNPEFCIAQINAKRHLFGADQKMQLFADKLLNHAQTALEKNSTLFFSLNMVGL
jgi:hypothetical protein